MGTQQQPSRMLIIEDCEDDFLLILAVLRQEGLRLEAHRVMTAPALVAALSEQNWDVVLCDHNLPELDSSQALALVQELRPDLPFIIVSGGFSDQATVEAIAAGAADVVNKDQLARLVPVLRRELREQQKRQRLEQLAYYDSLTGLPNENSLRAELQRRCQPAQPFGLILLSVRRLHQLARYLGLQSVDRLARKLAQCLQAELADSDSLKLAKIGFDRFAVLVTGVNNPRKLQAWMQQLDARLPKSIALDGAALPLSWGLGGSVYPVHGVSTAELYRNAERALSRAMAQSAGSQLFDPAWLDSESESCSLEEALHLALQRDEFFLDYQPQFDLHSGQRVGAEALLRWRHPQRGVVAPGEFIPLLEESGLIVPVGEWVLRSACRQAALWQRQGGPTRVAVNLAMVQFEQASLTQTVRSALLESELPAQALELEITESIAMNDQNQVVATLGELHEFGVSLAIDDFGTGYSSLAYLKHFPVDKLKIDKSFIQGIDHDPRDRAIVRAAIGMARALDLVTVAEGVESPSHVEFLRDHGCEQGQGFYLGRPMPPQALPFETVDDARAEFSGTD